MRDALSIMDQCSIYGKQEITAQIVLEVLGMSGMEALVKIGDAVLQEDTPKAINLVSEISAGGKDINQLIRDMVNHFRNLLMTKVVERPEDVIDQGAEHVSILKNHAEHYTRDNIIRCINILATLENESKFAANPRILLEIAVVKMCKVSHDLSHDGLMARLAKLELAVSEGTYVGSNTNSNTSSNPNINTSSNSSSGSNLNLNSTTNSGLDQNFASKKTIATDNADQKKNIVAEIKGVNGSVNNSASNAELGEGDMLRKWPGFIKSLIAERKMSIATMLRIGKPLKIDGNVITLTFDKEDGGYAKSSLEKPMNKSAAEAAAAKYFGKEIRLRCVIDGEIPSDNASVLKATLNKENELEENVIRLFGREKVEVVDEE